MYHASWLYVLLHQPEGNHIISHGSISYYLDKKPFLSQAPIPHVRAERERQDWTHYRRHLTPPKQYTHAHTHRREGEKNWPQQKSTDQNLR